MRRVFSCIALMLLLAGFLAASPADDQSDLSNKKDATAKPAIKPPKRKLRADVLEGKLIRIDSKERTLTVQVTTKIPHENVGTSQNIANLQRQLATTRDINSIRNIRAEIMKNQQNLVTYKDDVKKVQVVPADDMKVRT